MEIGLANVFGQTGRDPVWNGWGHVEPSRTVERYKSSGGRGRQGEGSWGEVGRGGGGKQSIHGSLARWMDGWIDG